MTLEALINLVATIIGLFGSVYVLKSYLELTPEMTERLSSGRYGHNLELVDSFAVQKAESIVGASLITFALFIVIVNAFIVSSISFDRSSSILACIVLLFLLLWLIQKARNFLYMTHRKATARIILTKKLDRLFSESSIPKNEINSLRHLNDKLLNLEIDQNATPFELVQLMAKEVGFVIPDNIKVDGKP